MRQLFFDRPGVLTWRTIDPPSLREPTDALVRPLAVARCDLDAAIVDGRAPFRSPALHWLRHHLPARLGRDGLFRGLPFAGPFAFGHECVAEVLATGDAVRSVAVGDRVVVPFQIACGHCDFCRRGVTASCCAVPHAASYGLGRGDWGGVLADVVRVPFADAMLLAAPPGVPVVELASAGDNVADGLRTVAGPLADRPGAPVLVVGGQAASVGLYALACARALGAGDLEYIDDDPVRLACAESLGARVSAPGSARKPRAFPITVDASADPRGLATALLATEPGGTCTSVGIYFAKTTPFPLLPVFMKGITFRTSRVCSRAVLPQVLDLIAAGRLRPSVITTRVAAWDDAPAAFLDRAPKVIVTRDPAA